jgi:hypothetical protein
MDIYTYFNGKKSEMDYIEMIDVNKIEKESSNKEILVTFLTDEVREHGFEIHVETFNDESRINILYVINIMGKNKFSEKELKREVRKYRNYFLDVKSIVNNKIEEYEIDETKLKEIFKYREYKNLKIEKEIKEDNINKIIKKIEMEFKLDKGDS